ncbi:MAG: acyltransferase family protein [Bacteroidales bacterium]|nr:acyltransferase family protein [Bacteroidales bacterium]
MEQNRPPRNETIDILKGLGIIGVVAGHCTLNRLNSPFLNFLYLFHVAIFFIASGYCYNPAKTETAEAFKKSISNTFKKLWTRYVLWTILFLALHNVFVYLNIYTNNPEFIQMVSGDHINTTNYLSFAIIISRMFKSLVFLSGTQLTGALWFLATLLELIVLYQTIAFILKRFFSKQKVFLIQSILSVLFLGLGYYFAINNIFLEGYARIPSFYILLHGGFVLKNYSLTEKERSNIAHFAIWAISLAALVACNQFGHIELSCNTYENPLFLIIASFAGWQFLYETATFIKRFNLISRTIKFINKNAITILALHFLSFKIITGLILLIEDLPSFMLASFPVLCDDHFWWIAYTLVGIAVPCLINTIGAKIGNRQRL